MPVSLAYLPLPHRKAILGGGWGGGVVTYSQQDLRIQHNRFSQYV